MSRLPLYCTISLLLSLLMLPLSASPDYRALGPFGGDVRSLAIHPDRPDRVFLGTADGQIYLSEDTGETWSKLTPGLGRRDVVVDNLAFHPEDPNTLYAASWWLLQNRGVLARSRDGGSSWEQILTGSYDSQIRAIAIAPTDPRVIALGISEGVLLSEDEGESWRRIGSAHANLRNVESLAFDPLDSATLYAGTWRLGWKTTDRGSSWAPIKEGIYFDSDLFSIVINPLDPSTIFASACTGVYRSRNNGSSWVKMRNGLPAEAKRTRTLHLDPDNPDRVYAGTTVGLYVTENSGQSWRRILDDVVINSVAVKPGDPRVLLVGTDDAGILKSSDQGKTFAPSNHGFIHRQIPALVVDSLRDDRLLASVAQDGVYGGFFVSDNGGRDWTVRNEGLGQDAASINAILTSSKEDRIFLATSGGVYYRNATDQPWKRYRSTAKFKVLDIVFPNDQESLLWAATDNGVIQIDVKSGGILIVDMAGYRGPIFRFFVDPTNGSILAATNRGLFRSDPQSNRWHSVGTGLPEAAVNLVQRAGPLLLAGTRRGLFVSRDNGATWSRTKSVFPLDISDLTANPTNPRHLIASDSTGGYLFTTYDGGESWKSFAPENRSRIVQVEFDAQGRLFAGTLSEGVYELHLPAPNQFGIVGGQDGMQ